MILYATSVSYVLIFVGFIITPAALSACYGAIIKKTWILTGVIESIFAIESIFYSNISFFLTDSSYSSQF